MRGMATLLQGNRELLVVRDKVARPPGELGVNKSMEYDIFFFQCSDTVGWATGRVSVGLGPGGLPALSLTTNSSWLTYGTVAMPPISPLTPVPHLFDASTC